MRLKLQKITTNWEKKRTTDYEKIKVGNSDLVASFAKSWKAFNKVPTSSFFVSTNKSLNLKVGKVDFGFSKASRRASKSDILFEGSWDEEGIPKANGEGICADTGVGSDGKDKGAKSEGAVEEDTEGAKVGREVDLISIEGLKLVVNAFATGKEAGTADPRDPVS